MDGRAFLGKRGFLPHILHITQIEFENGEILDLKHWVTAGQKAKVFGGAAGGAGEQDRRDSDGRNRGI